MQTDEQLEQRLREGRRYQCQFFFWLQDHHVNAQLEEFEIRARGAEALAAQRGEREDHPDIWLPDHNFAIEVKGRNIEFRYPKDYPYPDIHHISWNSLEKYRASGIPRGAIVVVSIPTLYMLALPWDPHRWWVKQVKDATTGDFFDCMVADRDQLRTMSWLLQFLRRQDMPNPGP